MTDRDAAFHSARPRVTALTLGGWALGGAAALGAIALACSFVGQLELAHPFYSDPVWHNRLLRLLAATIVGVALSASGAALQGLLRNPLAEPYILGVSSGAGIGVAVGTALAGAWALWAWAATPLLAAAGALATCGAVYAIAQRRGRLDPYALLLSGVIVNVFNGALMLVVMLLSERNRILEYIAWGMGRIPDNPSWALLSLCALTALACWTVLLIRGGAFNVLGLGDTVATSTGVNVHRLRVETFVVVSAATAAAVALAGPIGFIGLVAPHVCRLLWGPDHRLLVIVSGLMGAITLILADTLCRTAGGWLNVGDIPVGILTALLGGPFFIFLLRRRNAETRA